MNHLRGLSLFSGAGVAEALLPDVNMLLANEIDENRAKFYSNIYLDTKMVIGDIRNNDIKNQIIKDSKEFKINFIIATPPCQGMSEAGKRNILDDRNQLIHPAAGLARPRQPEALQLISPVH